MTTLIVIGIIIFAISRIAKKERFNTQNQHYYSNSHLNNQYDNSFENQEEELVHQFLQGLNEKFQLDKFNDDSIIDISNESYQINSNENNSNSYELINYPSGVPFWKHQYIYSTQPLQIASSEQQGFYKTYKRNFLNEVYFDVEGNSNYPFVLLFDLFDDYQNHNNLSSLRNQVNAISIHYPKTAPYARKMLFEQAQSYGSEQYVSEEQYFQNANYDYDYWKLGGKYKSVLELNEEQVALLNKIYPPSNNFFSIEFCAKEIMKLYLELFSKLDKKYIDVGTTRQEVFEKFLDIAVRKEHRYRNGSYNYRTTMEHFSDKLYENIFKMCENAVRAYYEHKRKLNVDFNFQKKVVNETLETEILSKIHLILESIITTVQQPNQNTEIQLNAQNRTRWRSKFKQAKVTFKNNPKGFETAILDLEELNKNNASIENIFFEAAKFIANSDSIIALSFYVYYVHYDLKSSTINNKKLPKTTLKKIFKNEQQQADFQKIIDDLVKTKNKEVALSKVKELFVVKRKKIQLDKTLIQEAHDKHSGTVELLNEYLAEEEAVVNIVETDKDLSIEEIIVNDKVETAFNENENTTSIIYADGIQLNETQKALLDLFFNNDFSVSFDVLDEFATSKGVFKNQLIDSVNDTCYEVLDDILIEEEEAVYTIYDDYYQTILTK